ncbi:MAG: SAM-dependent methyltransferase [Pseudonocardia sp.]|nr:SAM-dependent methyltransferase [Pseudonocardia sp.]
MDVEEREHVTAAWIARQAGVGRAAVANWRKRHADFPDPVAGGPTTPLFSWPAVRQWLLDTGKGEQLAAAGRTGTGTQQIGDAAPDRSLTGLSPRELLARVLVALLPRLGEGELPGDDVEPPLVLDPACHDPAVLVALAERYADHVRLAGQGGGGPVPDGVDLRPGDALRVDRFAGVRGTARAVVCVPPSARTWTATELAADPRWRFGLPDPADPDLAWVQHCLAHLRSRGTAVVVVSPVVAVRPSGRAVRAALVRAGVLSDVIALPASFDGAGQVWVLQRDCDARTVRMIDLSAVADPADVPQSRGEWDELRGSADRVVVRAVPQVELLDGETALVPARYLEVRDATTAAELGGLTGRLRRLYADLGGALPEPAAPSAAVRHPLVTLAELERTRAITILPRDATPRAGDVLFRVLAQDPVVATGSPEDDRGVAQVVGIDTERLDPHFVAAFVRADARAAPVANTHGALTRDDVRRCRIPRLPIAEQRRYGDALRHLLELREVAAGLAAATDAVITQTVHGLTVGALAPHAVTRRETIETSDANGTTT